jgi:DNA-binding NarL/FixJ family response regulator
MEHVSDAEAAIRCRQPDARRSRMSRHVVARAGEPARARTLHVVVADGSYLIRQALARIIESAAGIEVVASCSDREGLLRAIERTRPAVVVTDIRMPPVRVSEGMRMVAALRREHPGLGVVLLSELAEPGYGSVLLETGADGCAYLVKERIHSGVQLIAAIETVAWGGSLVDACVVDELAMRRTGAEHSPLDELTPREMEVLACIARGLSNQAIADELVLTKRAVEKHINGVFLKLGLSDSSGVSCRVKATLAYLADPREHGGEERRVLPLSVVARA